MTQKINRHIIISVILTFGLLLLPTLSNAAETSNTSSTNSRIPLRDRVIEMVQSQGFEKAATFLEQTRKIEDLKYLFFNLSENLQKIKAGMADLRTQLSQFKENWGGGSLFRNKLIQ